MAFTLRSAGFLGRPSLTEDETTIIVPTSRCARPAFKRMAASTCPRVRQRKVAAKSWLPSTPGSTSAVQYQVMWNRLISVVEEQAQALVRTAFSTSVREAGDLSAGVYDAQGRMLAQAVTGTPGHVNAMADAVPALHAPHWCADDEISPLATSTSPTILGRAPATCMTLPSLHPVTYIEARGVGGLSSPARRISSTLVGAGLARMPTRCLRGGAVHPHHETFCGPIGA